MDDKYFEILEESILGKYMSQGYQYLYYEHGKLKLSDNPLSRDFRYADENITDEDIKNLIKTLLPDVELHYNTQDHGVETETLVSVIQMKKGKPVFGVYFLFDIPTIRARRRTVL